MKRILIALFAVFISFAMVVPDAEAKRVGGGRNSGVQREAPAQKQAQAAPQQAPAGAAAQPKKNSWMGPLAGLAAGLGLAALFSSLGLGAEFGSLLTMLLIGVAVFFVIRLLMSRRRASAPANPYAPNPHAHYAAAGAPQAWQPTPSAAPAAFTSAAGGFGAAAPVAALNLPVGFDAAAFAREAKLTFIRMQAANDAGDLNDLRQFTSPEMFAEIKLDIAERGSATQRTDVVSVESELVNFELEGNRQLASVRFHGQIRESEGAAAEAFDEIWHFSQWRDSGQQWVVAGIQQNR
ncbi:Tim44 domain-containing protein [Chitinilyticum litopenaei]|uniref:Tim44 domain-containing protein n=1 Tax=Chitinilyticum litopenaei TaxID=1121276 RepID=UPI000419B2A4|nr:Tim44-like domain-containing protein [Chitinilyticum litopenaei]